MNKLPALFIFYTPECLTRGGAQTNLRSNQVFWGEHMKFKSLQYFNRGRPILNNSQDSNSTILESAQNNTVTTTAQPSVTVGTVENANVAVPAAPQVATPAPTSTTFTASVSSSSMSMMSKPSSKVKIIKRYQNRKLYDTQQSCYVTLDDIAKMIRANEEVMVIDNKSKNDITAATLTQIIFEAEKKASQYAPLFTLREIIQNANGSISAYLAKLGAFPMDYMTKQAANPVHLDRSATDDLKQTIETRAATAATRYSTDSTVKAAAEKATVLPGMSQEEETPNLPFSNAGLNQ